MLIILIFQFQFKYKCAIFIFYHVMLSNTLLISNFYCRTRGHKSERAILKIYFEIFSVISEKCYSDINNTTTQPYTSHRTGHFLMVRICLHACARYILANTRVTFFSSSFFNVDFFFTFLYSICVQ
jgi:hypothetical protein